MTAGELSIAIQIVGVAVTAGIVLRASKEHDRRLEDLEETSGELREQVARLDGYCEARRETCREGE
jgi:hypothetical protein